MGIFGFGRKERVVDLGAEYEKRRERMLNMKSDTQEQEPESEPSATAAGFGFLNDMASSVSEQTSSDAMQTVVSTDERKQRLVQRLRDMTEKIEDLSNQLYHMQQRIELLERKTGI